MIDRRLDDARDVVAEPEIVPNDPKTLLPEVICARQLPLDAQHRVWARQIAPIVARLLGSPSKEGLAEVHVTAVEQGDGASTVARQIAHTAARLAWCRVLLLDVHPVPNERNLLAGGPVPDLLESFTERHAIEVASVECVKTTFHAAALRQPSDGKQMQSVTMLRGLLSVSYDLIVTDCPPVLDEHLLAPVASPKARVVLVLRGGRTRISRALRAKQEIVELGGELFGAVLTKQHSYVPRWLDAIMG